MTNQAAPEMALGSSDMVDDPCHRFAEFSPHSWRGLAETGVFEVFNTPNGTDSAGMKNAIHQMRRLGQENPDRGLSFSAVTQLASTIYCLRAFGSEELQARYLPAAECGAAIGGHAITEEEAGSDVMNMTTTATLKGDHYLLQGAKKFITNAPIASTLIIYAKLVGGPNAGALSAFLVETAWPGVKITSTMPTSGLRSSPLGEVALQDVVVPQSHRIGYEGAGMLILDQVMKREILLAFAANIGEMERSIASSVDYVNSRQQFGATIGSNQLVANKLVDSQIGVELGKALLESIAEKIDGFDDITIPVAAAKVFISQQHIQTALNAIQVRGGRGYLSTEPFVQDLVDAVPTTIYSGSNDVLRSKIATIMGVKL